MKTNYNFTKVFIFLAGAAAGSVVTWKVLTSKYELYPIDGEYVEIVETAEETEDKTEDADISNPVAEKPSINDYVSTVDQFGYDTISKLKKNTTEVKEEKKEGADMKNDKPYIVSPEEFGELDNYEIISLTYYEGDKFLAEDADELVDDVEHTVGWESLEHFGDYEDDPDAVYVRNDKLKIDYEILRDSRNYSDVVKE